MMKYELRVEAETQQQKFGPDQLFSVVLSHDLLFARLKQRFQTITSRVFSYQKSISKDYFAQSRFTNAYKNVLTL